jgi:hypothetical protein
LNGPKEQTYSIVVSMFYLMLHRFIGFLNNKNACMWSLYEKGPISRRCSKNNGRGVEGRFEAGKSSHEQRPLKCWRAPHTRQTSMSHEE